MRRPPSQEGGGLLFLPSSCGNRDNPPRSQRRLCRGASVSFPSRRFHDFVIIPPEISDILPISLPQGAERAPVTLGRGGGGASASNPRAQTMGAWRGWPPGTAICRGESAVPFVSYCGMRRPIDEGRVIPSGPDETADRPASPSRRPLLPLSCDQAARRRKLRTRKVKVCLGSYGKDSTR